MLSPGHVTIEPRHATARTAEGALSRVGQDPYQGIPENSRQRLREGTSSPPRIDRHVKPVYNQPSYSSIRTPSWHLARGSEIETKNTDLLVKGP